MILKTIALVIALAACGTTPLPAGAVCKQTADCATGLSCLDVAQFTGTTCSVVGKSCSIVCTNDAGCATLGANFKCFMGCGADKFCAATGP
jgi:hypothetical protein